MRDRLRRFTDPLSVFSPFFFFHLLYVGVLHCFSERHVLFMKTLLIDLHDLCCSCLITFHNNCFISLYSVLDAAQLGKLTECLETILNKAQVCFLTYVIVEYI